jgi:hypothetical protein
MTRRPIASSNFSTFGSSFALMMIVHVTGIWLFLSR